MILLVSLLLDVSDEFDVVVCCSLAEAVEFVVADYDKAK